MSLSLHQIPGDDVLIRWDKGEDINVVTTCDLKLVPPTVAWIVGGRVKMWWGESRSWYYGTILESEVSDDEDNIPLSCFTKQHVAFVGNEEGDSNDDIPLSTLMTAASPPPVLAELTTVPLHATASNSCPSNEDELANTQQNSNISGNNFITQTCQARDCEAEIFAACGNQNCQVLLCFGHSETACPVCTPGPLEASVAPERFSWMDYRGKKLPLMTHKLLRAHAGERW